MSDSKLDESLKDFLEHRQKKKRDQCGEKLLQRHITDFFASQKDKFPGAKIDVQVTIKGNVDFLHPVKSYSPCERGDVSRVKKEKSTSASKQNTSQYDDDEDIIVMTTKKEVVEIEISDGENAAMKSDIKLELSEPEDWIVKSEVKCEDDDFDKNTIPKVFPIKEEFADSVKIEQEVAH